jgi:hypothetical protein
MAHSERGAIPGQGPRADRLPSKSEFDRLLSKPRGQALSQDLQDLLAGKPVRIPSHRVPVIKRQLRKMALSGLFPSAETALLALDDIFGSTSEGVSHGSMRFGQCGDEGLFPVACRYTQARTVGTAICNSFATNETCPTFNSTTVPGHQFSQVSRFGRYNVTKSVLAGAGPVGANLDQAISWVDFGPRSDLGSSSQLTSPNITPGWLNDPNVMRTFQPMSKPGEGVSPENDPSPQDDFAPYGGHEITPGKQTQPLKEITKREPPHGGVKERKTITRSKKFAALLFKALDKISESCEVVDAIYETLPKKTKKRWEAKQAAHAAFGNVNGGTRAAMLDNAGQYGLDGCDWKAEAIYHNAHAIDPCKSAVGIIKNHYEDIFIGRLQADRPVNTGNAVAAGDKAFAKWLNEQLDNTFAPLSEFCE